MTKTIKELTNELNRSMRVCKYCKKLLLQNKELLLSTYCNDECKKKMQKLWDERARKRICVSCGNPKLFKTQINSPRPLCRECILKIQIAFSRCNIAEREAKKNPFGKSLPGDIDKDI